MSTYDPGGSPRKIWVNADGTKRAGDASLTSAVGATGQYTITLADGATALFATATALEPADPWVAVPRLVTPGQLGTTVRVRVQDRLGTDAAGPFLLQVWV